METAIQPVHVGSPGTVALPAWLKLNGFEFFATERIAVPRGGGEKQREILVHGRHESGDWATSCSVYPEQEKFPPEALMEPASQIVLVMAQNWIRAQGAPAADPTRKD